MEEAQGTESVGDGDVDDIGILLDKCGAVEQIEPRSACHEGTAVDPHHDGLLGARFVGLIDIQVQAVLTLMVGNRQILAGELRKVVGLVDAVVRRIFHRCFPAQVADGLFVNEGDTLIGNNTLRLLADERSVYTLDG